jgi:uncharacterized protein YxeA
MRYRFTRLIFLFVLLAFVTSCGRTVYKANYVKSNKYIKTKKRYHFWHKHGYHPRPHYGGYW